MRRAPARAGRGSFASRALLPQEALVLGGDAHLVRDVALGTHVQIVLVTQPGNRLHRRRGVVAVNGLLAVPSAPL